jgi:hypothetical protein
MSYQGTIRPVLATLIALCLLGIPASPVMGQTTVAPTADRALLDRALAELESARLEAARIEFRVQDASAELDRLLAEQLRAQKRLSSRARIMYVTDGISLVSVLLGADSFHDLISGTVTGIGCNTVLTGSTPQDTGDLPPQ